jgi:hypothetical protein
MDPREIVGRRIQIQWGAQEWYPGVVSGFDPHTGLHHLRYDDGDERDYRLAEKTYVFVIPTDTTPPQDE